MKTINQLAIQLQKLIKKTSKKINEMINTRIQLETGNAEYKLPKIVCDSIETIYQTPFRLLGKFGEKQFKKSVRQILNILEDNSNKKNVIAHPFPFCCNIVKQVVLSLPYFYVNTHPLKYNESPKLDF